MSKYAHHLSSKTINSKRWNLLDVSSLTLPKCKVVSNLSLQPKDTLSYCTSGMDCSTWTCPNPPLLTCNIILIVLLPLMMHGTLLWLMKNSSLLTMRIHSLLTFVNTRMCAWINLGITPSSSSSSLHNIYNVNSLTLTHFVLTSDGFGASVFRTHSIELPSTTMLSSATHSGNTSNHISPLLVC